MTHFNTYTIRHSQRDASRDDRRASPRRAALRLTLAIAGGVALIAAVSCATTPPRGEAAPIFGVTIPPGYRDWKLISVAHEAGDLDDLRAVLGNDVAIEAYREGKTTLPDGSIIARLAWRHAASEENNKVFGREQSFVAGPVTNVQFMVKDSRKYAATGGWGYAHFEDGKPASEAIHASCAPCHAKTADAVFTRYAR